MAMPNLLLALLLTLLAVSVVYRRLQRRRRSRSLPLPPGPKGYPIIGNVLDIPRGPPLWEGSLMLGRQYSESAMPRLSTNISLILPDTDILYLNLFGKDLVILNSTKTISDLLDKRSKIYSDKVSGSFFRISASG